MKMFIFISLAFLMPQIALALGADTKGYVDNVQVVHTGSGSNSFRIYMSSPESDRFNCIANDGYITVSENGSTVSPTSYNQLYSLALYAHATKKKIGLDSAGSSPCANANMAFIE